MLYTTIPSILLSLVLYLIIGLCYDSKPVDISQYLTGLTHGFNISLFTMLVPAFTGWLIYRKTPSLITLLLSALSACICALILQPEVLVGIAGEDCISAKSLFQGIMTTCYTHTQVDCGMANINDLVATRGMAGMLNTIWLILCAMCFGSCMVASGMLHAITHVLLKSIHSTISLVCSTVTSGVLLNLVMGDQFLSIIMNASIYKDEYAERGYRPELLSRSTGNERTGSMDSLRYDAEYGSRHPDTGVSPLLLLQHHQPIDELSGSYSGLRTQAPTQGGQSICSGRV